jgi:hypothetical protein
MANNILDLVQGFLTPEVIAELSKKVGATPEQTQVAAEAGLHSILGGLANNAATPEGASGILGALDRDHDGSVLDDILGLVTGTAQVQNPNAANGSGILQHILGGNLGNIAGAISQMSGLKAGSVIGILMQLAPLVMGSLGAVKRNQGMDTSGLGNILGAVLQQTQTQHQDSPLGGILSQVLGGGGGLGNILGTLLGGGGGNNGGGLGSILGAVLGGGQQQQQQQQGGGLGDLLGAVLGGGQQKQQQQQQGGGLGDLLGAVLGGGQQQQQQQQQDNSNEELLNAGMKVLGGLFGKK